MGQSASASLAGEVHTEDGTAVAEAVVQARSEDNGALRTTVTDRKGRYRFEGLNPGNWTVIARVGDAGLSDSRSVQLRLQRTTRVDFTVGTGLVEEVTVRAAAPLVDRKETAGKMIVTGEAAEDLPLAGRVFTDLALLDSSVRQAAPGNYFGERGAVMSVNGQSGRSNAFLVDGLDNNDATSGTSLNSFFSQQVIQEFVLLTHQFSPEFGRAAGGVINIVTKQGTNDFTLGGFVQGSIDEWNEPGDFVESQPTSGVSQEAVSRFQAGFNFGGPIRKDRSFYFVAYEHMESDEVIAYTGVDRDQIEGGRVLAPSEDDNLFARFDFNFSGGSNLMLRLSADDRTTNGVNIGGVYTPESGFSIEEQDLQLGATWTSVIGGGVLSETRFLASTSEFDQLANSSRIGVNHPSGVFGGNTLQRQDRDEEKFQIVQNFTMQKGTHTLKFGVDVTSSNTTIGAAFNPNGNLTYDVDMPFNNGDCGDLGVSDLLSHDPDGWVHCPNEPDRNNNGIAGESANAFSYPVVFALVQGQPQSDLTDTQIALFAQDKVQLGKRWLLDYGLRYDVNTYQLDARVDSTVPNGGADRDTDNVAPRLGFTFSPKADGKWVVRGGAGVFYDKLVLAFPAVAAITSGTEILLLFPQGLADERVNETYIEDNGLDEILADAEEFRPFLEPLVMKFSTGTELDTPYTVQYNLGFERALGRNSAIRADVVHTLGYHLPMMLDLNPVSGLVVFPPPSLPCAADQIDPDTEIGFPCHLADPENVGSIAAVVTEGRSWYTGLDLNYRWQHDDNWFRASYTWSDSEDMGFDPLKGGIALPPDSTDLSGERGTADGQRDHRIVLSGDFPLPLIGLRASTVVQYATGIPFNVTTGTDDNLDGILSDRPEGVGRNTGEDTPLAPVNALRVEAGLEPVTSLDEPDFAQVDIRFYKRFGINQNKGNGELFLQVINLFDRENAGLIEGRVLSGNFGRTITLAGPPRTIELGLRFVR
jgi:hypothetical protein